MCKILENGLLENKKFYTWIVIKCQILIDVNFLLLIVKYYYIGLNNVVAKNISNYLCYATVYWKVIIFFLKKHIAFSLES